MAQAKEMAAGQPRDAYVEVRGARLHYRDHGAAGAPPVVILHGLTGHAWEFDELAAALADRFHVVAVNQRGHGASAWAPPYTPEGMADDVAGVLDALGIERARVIGHSMGGVHGWWFAARHPARIERLVVLDMEPEELTSAEVGARMRAMLDAYAAARFRDPDEAVAAFLAGYDGPQPERQRAFARANLVERAPGEWTWRCDARELVGWLDRAGADVEAHRAMLRRVRCPTLVVRAADSSFTSAAATERMVREVPDARWIDLPGAGHDLHMDQLDALVAELRAFL